MITHISQYSYMQAPCFLCVFSFSAFNPYYLYSPIIGLLDILDSATICQVELLCMIYHNGLPSAKELSMDELLHDASVRAQRYLAGLDTRGVAPTQEALANL